MSTQEIENTDEQQLSFLEELLDDQPGQVQTDAEGAEGSESSTEAFNKSDKTESKSEETDKLVQESSKELPVEETNQLLREQIIALTEALSKDPKQQAVLESVTTESQKAADVKTVVGEYLTRDELDRIIDEPQLLNVAIQRSQQAIIGNLGQIINAEVNKQIMVSRAVSDFYTANDDLLPYSKFVQFVMSEVETNNQDKTYKDIFDLTASECRKRLGLAKTPVMSRTSQTNNGNQQKPAFAGSKQGNSRPNSQQFFDANAADILALH